MTNAAVAEAIPETPVVAPEATAPPIAAVVESTGVVESRAQADERTTGAGTTAVVAAGDEATASTPDPVALAIAAGVELELAKRMPGEIDREMKARQQAYQETQNETARSQAFEDTVKTVVSGLTGHAIQFTTPDGQRYQVQLSEEDAQRLAVNPLNGYHAKVREIQEMALWSDLSDEALSTLPEAVHAAFRTAAKGKPIAEWLSAYREQGAPGSKWAALQELQAKKDKAEEYAKGFAEGAKSPGGQVSQQGTRSAIAGGMPSSLDEARQMHAGLHPSGRRISNDEMRAFLAAYRG